MHQQDRPDHSEDPRGTETGSGGYPEEQPGGAQPGAGRDRKGLEPDAPSTSSDDEGDPGQATGNPGAAG